MGKSKIFLGNMRLLILNFPGLTLQLPNSILSKGYAQAMSCSSLTDELPKMAKC